MQTKQSFFLIKNLGKLTIKIVVRDIFYSVFIYKEIQTQSDLDMCQTRSKDFLVLFFFC